MMYYVYKTQSYCLFCAVNQLTTCGMRIFPTIKMSKLPFIRTALIKWHISRGIIRYDPQENARGAAVKCQNQYQTNASSQNISVIADGRRENKLDFLLKGEKTIFCVFKVCQKNLCGKLLFIQSYVSFPIPLKRTRKSLARS